MESLVKKECWLKNILAHIYLNFLLIHIFLNHRVVFHHKTGFQKSASALFGALYFFIKKILD